MSRTITRTACAALAAGLLATAPVALARHGADDPVRPGSDDSPSAAPSRDDSDGRTEARRDRGSRSDVRVAGTCSASSTAKLKLSPEDGRVEVEFEVDQNRVGKRWGVVIRRAGTRVVSRSATTTAPSGSFEVRALVARASSGGTRVTAVARAVGTGEVCTAAATLA
jgi:hypothetical protein